MPFFVGSPFAAAAPALAVMLLLSALEGQAAPRRVDPSRRAEAVDPASADTRAVLPGPIAPERAAAVQESRFPTAPSRWQGRTAPANGRRAAVTLEETREKTLIDSERIETTQRERETNRWSGQRARVSTQDDTFRTPATNRFQEKIGEAQAYPNAAITPAIQKRTSFDRVNRFVFRKNRDAAVTVTPAGQDASALPPSTSPSPSVSEATISVDSSAETGARD
jgi:hypothetical protein